jgi:signal transduction histidine kinase
MLNNLVGMTHCRSGCDAERKRPVSEPIADGPNVKPSGAVDLARSSFSAGLGASAGLLLPNLLLGIFWFTALVTLILISSFLTIVWIVVMGVILGVLSFIRKPKWHMLVGGLTLMIAPVMWLCVSGAQIERRRVARFLGYRVPSPYRQLPQGSVLARARARVGDSAVWHDLAYILLLLPVGAAEFATVIAAFALPPVTIALPMWLFIAFPDGVPLGPGVRIDTPLEALIVAIIALPISALAGYLLVIGMSKAHAALGRALLWPSKRTRLAERVEELTESRSRTVEAAITERRRIERDLHDGAQQRLVSLAIGLGMAKEKMTTDPETAQELVEEAHEEAKRTLVEIRDLVRGIYPAVLSDRGLDAAISALAVRCPVPVKVDVKLDERPPETVETTAYFMVAEALANAAKHSGASEAQVFARREHRLQNRLVIEVVDNGKGGAEPETGTGLAGLTDRLAALDGRLFIDSPTGGPTRVRAELPLNTPEEGVRETP